MWYINPMDQFSFKTVSIVREVEHGDHLYRFHTNASGETFVKRVPVPDPLWSHGIICEYYSFASNSFKQSSQLDFIERIHFKSFENAVKKILGVHVAVRK